MAGRWESSSSNAWNRQPDQWSGRGSQVAASAAEHVKPSATSTDDPGSSLFDEQTYLDMTRDELWDAKEEVPEKKKSKGYAHAVRTIKLGAAFKNFRRGIVNLLNRMIKSKLFFMLWRNSHLHEKYTPFEDMLWTQDNLDYFLRTQASFEAHKAWWLRERQDRMVNRKNKNYRKAMSRMIPAGHCRMVQVAFFQMHNAKFMRYFGARTMEDILREPIEVTAEKKKGGCICCRGGRFCHGEKVCAEYHQ